ncbi:DEAD/DEAH box helicase, partial [Blastomonas sp.]|uniref:DEAD/DEAH box helicase n=1 Tax=Blastomonas sp. TaxID=1909299 RepID=UPI00406A906B
WERRRAEIESTLQETAKALVALAAARAEQSAPVIAPDPAAYERFTSTFAFTETPDQARAIAEVRNDLASGKPMDRLVIGDVGFGKTEIALRAAALVALQGGQVVVPAPPTVLVRQHLVRRQNIWHRSRRKLAECGPRLLLGFRRRAYGVASADVQWSVA